MVEDRLETTGVVRHITQVIDEQLAAFCEGHSIFYNMFCKEYKDWTKKAGKL